MDSIFKASTGLKFIISEGQNERMNGVYQIFLECKSSESRVLVEPDRKIYISLTDCNQGIILLKKAEFTVSAVLSGLFADGLDLLITRTRTINPNSK